MQPTNAAALIGDPDAPVTASADGSDFAGQSWKSPVENEGCSVESNDAVRRAQPQIAILVLSDRSDSIRRETIPFGPGRSGILDRSSDRTDLRPLRRDRGGHQGAQQKIEDLFSHH
jgi:hypothetical protein